MEDEYFCKIGLLVNQKKNSTQMVSTKRVFVHPCEIIKNNKSD